MTGHAGSMALFPDPENGKNKRTLTPTDQTSHSISRESTVGGQEEQVVVYNYSRMLQDPTGRLCEASLLQNGRDLISRTAV